MQFKVPQFLDVEDKIFGPFTFKEFIYLVGGAGLCYVIYKAMGLLLGFIPIAIVAGLAGALTFYRPNGKPFILMLESGFKYLTQNKLFVWKRRMVKKEKQPTKYELEKKQSALGLSRKQLGGSKLRDLAWSLDVLDAKKE